MTIAPIQWDRPGVTDAARDSHRLCLRRAVAGGLPLLSFVMSYGRCLRTRSADVVWEVFFPLTGFLFLSFLLPLKRALGCISLRNTYTA